MSRSETGDRVRRRWPSRLLASLALVAALVGGLVAAVRGGWLGGAVRTDPVALARLDVPGIGGRLVSVEVVDAKGRMVPVRFAGGRLWPVSPVAQGEPLSVEATFSRPGPLGWLFGGGARMRLSLVTPQTQVVGRWLRFPAGRPIVLRFSEPVQAVSLDLGGRRVRRVFASPQPSVATGLTADRMNGSGEAVVVAAPRSWEQPTAPVRVRWFPPGAGVMVQAAPRYGGTLHPWQQLRLTFSQPLDSVLGKRLPRVSPATAGSWQRADSHTLVFTPGTAGFPLAATVQVRLPASVQTLAGGTVAATGSTLQWQVVTGSVLRLQQLLAGLGYLPLAWQPASQAAVTTAAGQLQAALHPPPGTFQWRYPDVPRQLAALWRPGRQNLPTRSAVMAFEQAHGLPPDGVVDAAFWSALLGDAAAGAPTNASGYSYVLVSRKTPQTLSLWHDGRVVVRSRVNAGTSTQPVALGTFTVQRRVARLAGGGAGPSGGVLRWLSYFSGGEALHSADRRSFGYPQSAGGIELPAPVAFRLWPYTTIGTLVTITR